VWIRLVWTDEADDHVARHGLTRADVESALGGPHYVRSARTRQTVIARGTARALFIVLSPLPGRPGHATVVTARPATWPEEHLLRRRGKWFG